MTSALEVEALFGKEVVVAANVALGDRWHIGGFDAKNVFLGNKEKNVSIDRKTHNIVSTVILETRTKVQRKR